MDDRYDRDGEKDNKMDNNRSIEDKVRTNNYVLRPFGLKYLP